MAYCINPDCSRRENPDNCAVCQNCQTPLIFNNRYRINSPLPVSENSYTEIFIVEDLLQKGTPKILKSLKVSSPNLTRLFTQEAKILLELKHPGIPQGEKFFQLLTSSDRKLSCLVMEKIIGEDLQSYLEKLFANPDKVDQPGFMLGIAIDWLKQITEILDFVHTKGFFHRDIKPGNIMVRSDGKLMLIDFGTARQFQEKVINNQPVTIICSIGYTAPEQIAGQAVLQSDFYALGKTFIYLLTGINPALDNRVNSLNWDKYLLDKTIPTSLINLLKAMTADNYRHRPVTAKIILEKLKQIEQLEKSPHQRRQKLFLKIGGMICLLGFGIIGINYLRHQIIPKTCDNQINDNLSCGEESLISTGNYEGYFGKQPPEIKQSAIQQFRNGNYQKAEQSFQQAFAEQPDPETLVYLNNTRVKLRFTNDRIRTIAIAIPLKRSLERGLDMLRGVAQAQEEAINKGQALRVLIAEDNNRDSQEPGHNAIAVAKKLVTYQDLLAVIGHHSSDATIQTLETYQKAGMVLISPTSTSDNLKNPFFFRTIPRDRVAGEKIADYIFKTRNQTRAAIFYSHTSEYAKSLAAAIRTRTKTIPNRAIIDDSYFNLAVPKSQFKAHVKNSLNLAKSKGATAIILIPDAAVSPLDAIPNAKQIIELNQHRAIIVGSDSLYLTDLLKLKSPIPTVFAVPWHYLNPQLNPNITNTQFINQARKSWQISPTEEIYWTIATSYDALFVLSEALQQIQTSTNHRRDIQKILQSPQFAVMGVNGKIQFDENGNLKHTNIRLVTVKKCQNPSNRFVPIELESQIKCE